MPRLPAERAVSICLWGRMAIVCQHPTCYRTRYSTSYTRTECLSHRRNHTNRSSLEIFPRCLEQFRMPRLPAERAVSVCLWGRMAFVCQRPTSYRTRGSLPAITFPRYSPQ
ncbi:hypothetical protein CDAR_316581 [Caerostris darwini]|uniref:Secreted protein n=1 Tax=Caerostris darwini TaxID=1538125 RepID=A0AAV4UJ87_9ARAC|nr:hypothetical protein CDAR_316581 [Caerostris darwini]